MKNFATYPYHGAESLTNDPGFLVQFSNCRLLVGLVGVYTAARREPVAHKTGMVFVQRPFVLHFEKKHPALVVDHEQPGSRTNSHDYPDDFTPACCSISTISG